MALSKEFEIFAVKRWEDHRVFKIHMASLQGTKNIGQSSSSGNQEQR